MKNKHILLAVCGGIAAYKAAELVRLLRKQQAEVQVVMTEAATKFIAPLTFQSLSAKPVQTQLLDQIEENAMGHINLARWADVVIVAPTTANMLAKLAHGLADDLVSTLCLAAQCPIYLAPAMNQAMWQKAVTQDNLKRLQNYGFNIIGPAQGEQACGETGYGRMSEADEICRWLIQDKSNFGTDSDKSGNFLHGFKILISAGPTREPLDPVRYITNRSSGKMGYALAESALDAGAVVTLVSGPVQLDPPVRVEIIQVETAAQMYQAVISQASVHDVYIGAAAVADYTPAQVQTEKIKKQGQDLMLKLQKTKDIVAAVAALADRPFVVGFAAETHDIQNYAQTKLVQKKLDMIAANLVGQERGGFDKNENELHVFWRNGDKILPMTDKRQLAKQLLALIAEKLNEKKGTVKNFG